MTNNISSFLYISSQHTYLTDTCIDSHICFYHRATGMANFADVAPDTITDFVANAYAIHPDTGLGVAPVRSNVRSAAFC